MIDFNKNIDKNMTKSQSQLNPKRHLEVNAINDNNNNINNKNNLNNNYNKRVKTNGAFNYNISSKELNYVTKGVNRLSTNSRHSNQPMADNASNASNGHKQSDDFEDDLNDEVMNLLLSQVVNHEPNRSTVGHNSQSDYSMSIGSDDTAREDVSMNTYGSTDMSAEAKEGRIKVLESKNKTLTEEVNRSKTQVIQKERTIKEMKEEYNQRIKDLERKHNSELMFIRNENSIQLVEFEQLKAIVQSSAQFKHKPNSNGINKIEIMNNFLRQNNNRHNFSQQKLHEFYAIGSDSNTQTTSGGSSSILAPESQALNAPTIHKKFKYSDSFPTEIPSTQLQSSSGGSSAVPMDTTSTQSTSRDPNNSQNMSQSQVQALKWEPIRAKFETKFQTNNDYLGHYFINQSIELFSDHWIRSPQEITDWSTELSII